MTNRRLNQAIRRVLSAAKNFVQRTTKAFVLWVLKGLLLYGRQPVARKSGFVLPTTVLLLLVLTLTVGAITLRTYSRTEQAIGERSQRVVYNAATPAIDRAKAKLEYLFNRQRDPRLPSGIPGETQLWGMMVNDGEERNGLTVPPHRINNDAGDPVDPYTFPDETRLDLDGDGLLDNAWSYRTDTNGDGEGNEEATVAYSILSGTPADPANMQLASDEDIANRADALQVRHGPLSATTELNTACVTAESAAAAPVEAGWFTDQGNSSVLRKNFQVDAYILPDDANGTVATVEFHQDRQLAKGNKWGAWFRNDLEIFPGPEFNWNGAMHTEGNLVVGNTRFHGFLVSSPASCLYTREASEITVTDIIADPDNNIPAFQAQVMSGKINDNSFGGNSEFHLYGNPPIRTGDNNVRLDSGRDSVAGNNPRPAQYALDPIALVTRDVSVARDVADPSTERAGDWINRKFVTEGRIYNQAEDAPYLDDFYRADNRYGPKPRVSKRQIPGDIGEPITGEQMAADNINDDALINLDASVPSDVGLDGYWERRATVEGMKLIVGQRLELGNAFGWGLDLDENDELDDTDGDGNGFADEREAEPLYAAESCPGDRCHETLQRKTLYDNLAAVQSLAVYHSSHENGGEFPAACMAFTAHPGTAETIKTSRTFEDSGNGLGAYTDFLNGKGTNGWEFDAPGGFSGANAETSFANAIASTQPLGIALRNLAHFAGDPQGGAPSFTPMQEAGGDIVHPYPNLTMWGDYSMLRRVLSMMDGASAAQGNPTGGTVAYADLSPADKATLHTAACMMGMLGHNAEIVIDRAERAAAELSNLTPVGQHFTKLMDANPNNGDINDIFIEEDLDNGDPNPYYDGRFNQPNDYYDDWAASGMDVVNVVEDIESPGDYLCAPGEDDPAVFQFNCDIGDYANQFTLDQYIVAFGLLNPINQATAEEFEELMTQLLVGYQLLRDRAMGFTDGLVPNILGSSSLIAWDEDSGYTGETNLPAGQAALRPGCDPNIFNEYTGGGGGGGASNRDAIALSVAVCGESLAIRYPALYYLLPVYNHDHLGTDNIVDWDDQPDFEEYVADTYIYDPGAGGVGVNDDYTYTVVGDDNGDGFDEQDLSGGTGEDSVGAIALAPHALNFGDWVLPVDEPNPSEDDPNLIYSSDATGEDYNSDRMAAVPLLDKGIYNGRELMGTRVLDIDWGLLHDSARTLDADANGNADHWLPNSGIVYAFREDAVREDGIVRPRNADWAACDENATYERTSGPSNGSCRMKADPGDLQDPPLNTANAISPKAVDYYPDPDRRPNGFRLFNGAKLNRNDDNGQGMTFVADAPVYIKGNFNWHQTIGCNETNGCRLEEFQTKLQDNFSNFYNRNNLDIRFARQATDLWRPSEILADAVSIVSNNLCDGSMEDYFITAGTTGASIGDSENRYGCSGNSDRTTYLNATRPSEDDTDYGWLRANSEDARSPIVVSRNGMPMIIDDADDAIKSFEDKAGHDANDFYNTATDKPLNNAQDSRVNAIIISGLVPSRDDQAYGGLHNFPRFLENWNKLYISGSLLQLNFSNYATAPFDQDAWETDENTTGTEVIRYYRPPNRLWGYDVGLQYAPAGPIAERFVTPQTTRSEFYSEPPADDQYMVNLCRQIAGDPAAQCGA
ncbi:MAG: hormogonium polysaccharide biosynthesis protein HpsA [Elainellaceae cyanobacterium]